MENPEQKMLMYGISPMVDGPHTIFLFIWLLLPLYNFPFCCFSSPSLVNQRLLVHHHPFVFIP